MTYPDQIDRRGFLRRSGAVGAAAVGAAAVGTSWYGLAAPAEAATNQCRWGSLVLGRGAQSQMTAVKLLEQKVGRRFDTTHYRMPWATDLVNSFTSWSANTGHTQILLLVRARARRVGQLARHRPGASGCQDHFPGSCPEGRRMEGVFLLPQRAGGRRHRRGLEGGAQPRPHDLRQRGRDRVKWVVTLMASTYQRGDAPLWMPAKYDLLGVDGYNRYHCRGTPWKSFSQIFGYARNYAKAHGRNLYIVESGCVEGEPGRKAAWFDGARATLKTWPEVVGFSYNSEDTDCTYWADSTSGALNSFSSMGRDSYFR